MEGNKEQKIVNAKIELSVVIEEWSLISEQFLNTIREVVYETNDSTANAQSSVTIFRTNCSNCQKKLVAVERKELKN